MGKYCPVCKRKVTYLVCMDCEEKECQKSTIKKEDVTMDFNDERGHPICSFNNNFPN